MLVSGLALIGLVYLIESDAETLRAQARELAFKKAQAEEQFETSRLLEQTADERNSLREYILTEGTVIDFISTLESIAAEQGLSFSTQAITPEVTKDALFDNLTMGFAFSGPKENVSYLVKVLESVPFRSQIDAVTLREEDDGVWTATVKLFVIILEYED